jgi:TolA-binding protein
VRKILVVLSFVFAVNFFSGCGSDQYAIERKFWYTQKQANSIFKNPHTSPPQELERIISVLNDFIKKFPDNKLSVQQEFTIGRLYIVKEQYKEARSYFEKVIAKHSAENSICSDALFLIGNSYQLENKWNMALESYKKIMAQYPTTSKGLDVPLYIANYYETKYQPEKMIEAYKEAIGYYNNLAAKYPDTLFGFIVSSMSAQCYVALKDWARAIESFNALIAKYKDKVSVDQALMNLSIIYKEELKDKDKAKEYLEKLNKDYPKSRFKSMATAMLKELNKNE